MRVLFLDDSLTGWAGHNAGYDFALQDELAQRGVPSLICANIQAAQLAEVRPDGLRLTFRHYADLTPHNLARLRLPAGLRGACYLLVGNWRHWRDLRRTLTAAARSGDVVVATMQSSYTSFANAAWLWEQRLRRKRLTFLLVVHTPPSRFFRSEWRALHAAAGGWHTLRLAAHTGEIAAACAELTGVTPRLLPLPFVGRRLAAGAGEPGRPGIDRPLRVTYLGMATYAKGYDVVLGALADLGDLLAAGTVQAVVQFNCYAYDAQNLAWQRELHERFGAMRGVTILEGSLSDEAYGAELARADLALVPNRAAWYGSALSGIFTEAAALGKPVLVTEGSFMAKELRRGAGAGLIFADGDGAALAQAIRQAAARYAELHAQAQAHANAWRDEHAAARYVDFLLAP